MITKSCPVSALDASLQTNSYRVLEKVYWYRELHLGLLPTLVAVVQETGAHPSLRRVSHCIAVLLAGASPISSASASRTWKLPLAQVVAVPYDPTHDHCDSSTLTT